MAHPGDFFWQAGQGGIVALLYLAAAWACHRAAQSALGRGGERMPGVRERLMAKRFWTAAMLALALVACWRIVGLSGLVSHLGRTVAMAGGWYDGRRVLQADLIAAMIAGVGVAVIVLASRMRGCGGAVLTALAGLTATLLFVAVRATSLHQVDALLTTPEGALVGDMIELGGLAMVAGGALAGRRRPRRYRHRPPPVDRLPAVRG